MQAALRLMASFFAGVRNGPTNAPKMLDFCCRATSPAEKAVMRLFQMLGDQNSRCWLPFLQGGTWTSERLHAAACGAYNFAGLLAMKTIMPFDAWPLELGKLIHPAISQGDKMQVGDDFWKLRSCCPDHSDGCTFRLRQSLTNRSDVDAAHFLELLEDIFDMLEPSNIKSEDRFGRARMHTHVNQGASVFCSDHLLSEWAALHEAKYVSHLSDLRSGVEDSAQGVTETASFTESWANYVRQKTSNVKDPPSLATLGAEWALLSLEQKQEWTCEVQRPKGADAPVEFSTLPATWSPWGLGSEAWPINLPAIEEITDSIDALSKRWRTLSDVVWNRHLQRRLVRIDMDTFP